MQVDLCLSRWMSNKSRFHQKPISVYLAVRRHREFCHAMAIPRVLFRPKYTSDRVKTRYHRLSNVPACEPGENVKALLPYPPRTPWVLFLSNSTGSRFFSQKSLFPSAPRYRHVHIHKGPGHKFRNRRTSAFAVRIYCRRLGSYFGNCCHFGTVVKLVKRGLWLGSGIPDIRFAQATSLSKIWNIYYVKIPIVTEAEWL